MFNVMVENVAGFDKVDVMQDFRGRLILEQSGDKKWTGSMKHRPLVFGLWFWSLEFGILSLTILVFGFAILSFGKETEVQLLNAERFAGIINIPITFP